MVIEENTEVTESVNKLEAIGLQGKNVANPIRMLQEIKNEPIYDDFLQYITMCGPLNFRLVAPDKWHAVKNIIKTDKSLSHINSNEFAFLDELFIPQNVDLGNMLEAMYAGKTFEDNQQINISFNNTQQSNQGRTSAN